MKEIHKRLHILVVDDEEDMCWALQRIIESEGHSSTVASSAQKALQIMATTPFDLAFVDVKLPDMDGLELVQRMRRLSSALPCVLVSGYFYDDDEPVQASLAAGQIAGFIGKPFQLTQVQDALKRFAVA